MSAIQRLSQPILLSIAEPNEKRTTTNFRIVEVHTLFDLKTLMNRYAISAGLFMNGYRNSRNLRQNGNLLLIDIDHSGLENGTYYYESIEQKLIENQVSFVSVPSQSANEHAYKRHIALILDSSLPTDSRKYEKAVRYILQNLCIDIEKLDYKVMLNIVAHFAPASINKKFKDFDSLSTVFEANQYRVPSEYQQACSERKNHQNEISTNQLIQFSDGKCISLHDAKKIMALGSKEACHCPSPDHDDRNPSATFFYNNDNSVNIFCAKCGPVRISNYFFSTQPNIDHKQYQYHIAIEKNSDTNIENIIQLLGEPSFVKTEIIGWFFKVYSIDDIYAIFLAKAFLINNGYLLANMLTYDKYSPTYGTELLNNLIVNQMLPKIYVKSSNPMSPYDYVYIYMKQYIYRHRYFFVEAAIFSIYQNVIDRGRTFEETCNNGLSYFEYILRSQLEDTGKKQKDKRFPMKLSEKQRKNSDLIRKRNKAYTDGKKITIRRKRILKIIREKKFLKRNGKVNKTDLASFLEISRQQLYTDLNALGY